jgi:hypothetical protein
VPHVAPALEPGSRHEPVNGGEVRFQFSLAGDAAEAVLETNVRQKIKLKYMSTRVEALNRCTPACGR